jgi:hypothetical protein
MDDNNQVKALLEAIRPFFDAFEKGRRVGHYLNTRQKLAGKLEYNEADLGAIFRKLRDEDTNRRLTEARYEVLIEQFKKVFRITEDGKLEETGLSATKAQTWIRPYQDFKEAQFEDRIANSDGFIWHINTYIYPKLLAPGNEHISPIEYWLKAGRNVRILLLRPDGKALRLRTNTTLKDIDWETRDGGREWLVNHLSNSFQSLFTLQEKYPGLLEVRLFDEIPGVNCFILPNRAFVGFHLTTGHSEIGPCLEIEDPHSTTYLEIKKHFETIWDNNKKSTSLDKSVLDRVLRSLRSYIPNIDSFKGTWNLHFHELNTAPLGDQVRYKSDIIGKVTTARITFEQDSPTSVYPQATISFPGGLVLHNTFFLDKLMDRTYAHIRFTDLENLSMHLTFSTKQEGIGNPMYGFFVFSSRSECRAGLAILTKEGEQAPSINYKFAINRLLQFMDHSYMSLDQVNNRMETFLKYTNQKFPIQGYFQVYSYGGKKDDAKYIKKNALYIDESGIATYYNQHFGSDETIPPLHGRATLIGDNVHIVFTSLGEDRRRSYLIISRRKSRPKNGTYYSAVHLGVSWDKSMPHGKRFILEYKGEILPENVKISTIRVHSEDYKKLPLPLRNLLTGRFKNLLGFLRMEGSITDIGDLRKEDERSIRMSEVFFDSALMSFYRGDTDACATMLLRAVNHGFDDLNRFVQEAQKINGGNNLERVLQHRDFKAIITSYGLTLDENA